MQGTRVRALVLENPTCCGATKPPNVAGGASVVAHWFRIRLPMQGTQARALVREDPTCRRAIKPVRHNY
ncbi:hypothetical protein J1605_006166 [Eschrichtius robustus]|uniref:Uncharacterized protein n=1 Tax=Eschrichtius robustus TaxID=9764 RepID=A0AB34H1M9_ESCRO|nr:hypothetical protein J1605_006166 [Eschrichtius robustus]